MKSDLRLNLIRVYSQHSFDSADQWNNTRTQSYFVNNPLLNLSANQTSYNISQMVEINMTIFNVTNLSGIQINVTFDSSRLNYINTTEGEFLSENDSASTYFNESEINTSTPGLLKDIIVVRQGEPDGVTGQGVLVSIYFNATATGTAYVNVSGGLLSSNEATSISYDTGNSSFTIGSGPDTTAPTVTLNDPVDLFNTTSQIIVFNATAYDDINLTNMTLY